MSFPYNKQFRENNYISIVLLVVLCLMSKISLVIQNANKRQHQNVFGIQITTAKLTSITAKLEWLINHIASFLSVFAVFFQLFTTLIKLMLTTKSKSSHHSDVLLRKYISYPVRKTDVHGGRNLGPRSCQMRSNFTHMRRPYIQRNHNTGWEWRVWSVNFAATFDIPLWQLPPRRKPVRNCVARSLVSKKHGRQSVF